MALRSGSPLPPGRNDVLSAGCDDARVALRTHLADVHEDQRRAVSAGAERGIGEPQAVGGAGEGLGLLQLAAGDGLAGLADQFDGPLLHGRRGGRRRCGGISCAGRRGGVSRPGGAAAAGRSARPRRAAAIRSSKSCGFCSNGPYTIRTLAARPANRSASSNSPQRASPSAWSIMLRT